MDYDIFMAIVSIGFVAIYTPYVVIGTVFDWVAVTVQG